MAESLQRGDQETLTTLTQNQDTSVITYTDEDGDPNPITPVVLASNTKIEDGTVDLDKDGDLDDGVTLQEVIENGFGNETLTSISQNQDTSVITYTDENDQNNSITPVVLAENTKIQNGTIDITGNGISDINVSLQDVIGVINKNKNKFVDGFNSNQAVYRAGNVGIGTNNPSEALDVVGNVKFQSIPTSDEDSAYSLDIDPSTGILSKSVKKTGLFVNGTYGPRQATYTGEVGINTNNPSEALDVVGNVKFQSIPTSDEDSAYSLDIDPSTGILSKSVKKTGLFVNGTYGPRQATYTGEVGINTNNPSEALDVVGNVKFQSIPTSDEDSAYSLDIDPSTGILSKSVKKTGLFVNGTYGPRQATYTGEVGINTNNPSEALDVVGNVKFQSIPTSDEDSAYSLDIDPSTGILSKSVKKTGLFVNGTYGPRQATYTGEVGINTNNPSAALDVVGSVKFQNIPTLYESANFSLNIDPNTGELSKSHTKGLFVNGIYGPRQATYTGEVGINNNNPTEALDVVGNVKFQSIPTSDEDSAYSLDIDPSTGILSKSIKKTGLFVNGTYGPRQATYTGEVGINTNNPSEALDVVGNVKFQSIPTSDEDSAYSLDIDPSTGILSKSVKKTGLFVNGTYGSRQATYTGEVGINTNNPSEALDVVGNVKFQSIPTVYYDPNLVPLLIDKTTGIIKKNTIVPVRMLSTYITDFNQHYADYSNATLNFAFGAGTLNAGASVLLNDGVFLVTGTYGEVAVTGIGGNTLRLRESGGTTIDLFYDTNRDRDQVRFNSRGTFYQITIIGN